MTPLQRITLWWVTLAAGLGGLTFFVYLCSLYGPPTVGEVGIYSWPVISIFVATVSARALRRYYQTEPDAWRGFWQLSIIDLYAVIFFTAANMAIWKALYPAEFNPRGMVMSLIAGAGYSVCLLVSARQGCKDSVVKIPYALAMFFRAVGWMGAGALGAICLFLILYAHSLRAMVECVGSIFFGSQSQQWGKEIVPIRVSLIFLPVGVLLGRVIKKWRRDVR